MNYLIIDYGTSSCRASVVDNLGRISSSCRKTVDVISRGCLAEIDPDKAWAVVLSAVNELLQSVPAPDIGAVGVSSLLGWVFLDSQSKPIGNSIIWMDNRGDEQLNSAFSPDNTEIYKKTGRRLSSELLISKWAWLRRHQVEITSKTVKIISLKDELIRRLTGEIITDYAHLNYTMLWNINDHQLDPELLELAEINSSLLPEGGYPYEAAGGISSDAAALTGLTAGLPVIKGSIDGTTAMYGGGIALPETSVHVSGTTDVIMTLIKAGETESAENKILTINTGMIPGTFAAGGSTSLSGGALTKMAEMLEGNYLDLIAEVNTTGAGADGILCIPGFSGERAPYWNTGASGSLIGLRMQHHGGHILRAVMEGAAFRLKRLLLELTAIGAQPKKLHIVGGCSNINIWNTIKADVIGLPLLRLAEPEATTIGTAMFCDCFINQTADLETISSKWINIEKEFSVNNSNHRFYDELFIIYENYLNENIKTNLALGRLKRNGN